MDRTLKPGWEISLETDKESTITSENAKTDEKRLNMLGQEEKSNTIITNDTTR